MTEMNYKQHQEFFLIYIQRTIYIFFNFNTKKHYSQSSISSGRDDQIIYLSHIAQQLKLLIVQEILRINLIRVCLKNLSFFSVKSVVRSLLGHILYSSLYALTRTEKGLTFCPFTFLPSYVNSWFQPPWGVKKHISPSE